MWGAAALFSAARFAAGDGARLPPQAAAHGGGGGGEANLAKRILFIKDTPLEMVGLIHLFLRKWGGGEALLGVQPGVAEVGTHHRP